MRKIAIIYNDDSSTVIRRAIELLSEIILDETYQSPLCFKYSKDKKYDDYYCFYIGVGKNFDYINNHSHSIPQKPEGYSITVKNSDVFINGYDDSGVLYGCMDFYNKYIVPNEEMSDGEKTGFFNTERQACFCFESSPGVSNRGIWTWGHVIYDYKKFIDNMVKLKLNTLILWNDFVPFNAKEIIEYAHNSAIKVIWGFAWGWNDETIHGKIDLDSILNSSLSIFEKYRKEYASLDCDGIYFQSFTEIKDEYIGDVLVAEVVTQFVNKTSNLFFEQYPNLELQFGLHATSVNQKLEYIKKTDSRIRIVWEDCGAFPFAYKAKNIEAFEETKNLVKSITNLRGENDLFGVVTKGLTNLDWGSFSHMESSCVIGVGSKAFKTNRVIRKRRYWKKQQAYWLVNAHYAHKIIDIMAQSKKSDLYVTGLVEDGMFEENIMFPVALYAEMLWNTDSTNTNELIANVAQYDYVEFA